jgi:hypothetical protein
MPLTITTWNVQNFRQADPVFSEEWHCSPAPMSAGYMTSSTVMAESSRLKF